MDGQTAWLIISALATTLAGVVTAAFRFLLDERRELKEQLRQSNDAVKETNKLNATLAAMVPGLLADKDAALRSRVGGS